MSKPVATIRVSIETSRYVADNGATVIYVIDDAGNRFPISSAADVAFLAPHYVRGNSANGLVLGQAHNALVGLARLRRQAEAEEAAIQRMGDAEQDRYERSVSPRW